MITRYFTRPCAVVLGTSLTIAGLASSAPAAVLYQETFEGTGLQSNSAGSNATISGGDLDINDASASGRGRFTVLQDFGTASALTFSFKITAPVTQADPEGGEVPDQALTTNELLIRVGPGTSHNTASSSEDVLESVIYRDGPRGGYSNNGNETVFLIANNSGTAINFTNPVTELADTLDPLQYMAFIFNDTTDLFTQVTGKTAFQDGDAATPGTQTGLTRLGIGNASNANQGTWSIDNVQVLDEISFVNPAPVPEPSALALLGVGGLLALRRRR